MKKIISFIMLVVLSLAFVGCSNESEYAISKDVKIKDEVSAEEANTEIQAAKDQEEESIEGKKFSIKASMKSNDKKYSVNYTYKVDLTDKEAPTFNCNIELKTNSKGTFSLKGKEYLAKDGYLYLNATAKADISGIKNDTTIKNKAKMPDVERNDLVDSVLSEVNFKLENYLSASFDYTAEGVKVGYDSKGAFIVDVDTEDLVLRAVYKNHQPMYFYANDNSNTIEVTFNYSNIKVSALSNLDSYNEVDYDDLFGLADL